MSLTKPVITLSFAALLTACGGGQDIETVKQSSPLWWLEGQTVGDALKDRDACKSVEWEVTSEGYGDEDVVIYHCDLAGVEAHFAELEKKVVERLTREFEERVAEKKQAIADDEQRLEDFKTELAQVRAAKDDPRQHPAIQRRQAKIERYEHYKTVLANASLEDLKQPEEEWGALGEVMPRQAGIYGSYFEKRETLEEGSDEWRSNEQDIQRAAERFPSDVRRLIRAQDRKIARVERRIESALKGVPAAIERDIPELQGRIEFRKERIGEDKFDLAKYEKGEDLEEDIRTAKENLAITEADEHFVWRLDGEARDEVEFGGGGIDFTRASGEVLEKHYSDSEDSLRLAVNDKAVDMAAVDRW